MYQSSPRKNFLDILIEPTSIAILVSIALHALIGASLPFFTQLEKEIKKADPGTVKVVELTPNELQRIPQAPPIPAPQVATPVPNPQAVTPPATPPISPNSPTIPFSPIRIPLEKLIPQPAKGKKDQQAIPQKQPNTPLFDRNISFNPTPTPTPTKPPKKKATTTKPTLVPIPKPVPQPIVKKPKPTIINPIPTVDSDDDGGNLQPSTPATSSPQAQKPTNTPPAATTNPTRPAGQSGTQPSGTPGSDGNGFPYPEGKFRDAVFKRLVEYQKAYPGIKPYPTILLSQSYPPGAICPKVKQSDFIVLMAAFDKVPEKKEGNPLGDSTAPSIDEPYVAADRETPENRKLAEIAVNAALYAANKADQDRPVADRDKRVLYQYVVRFDQTTCKR